MPPPPGSFSRDFLEIGEVQTSAQGSHLEAAKAAAQAAPFLFGDFSEEEMKVLERKERAGEWTGARLAQRDPRVYAIIVKMLAADYTAETIAALCGVSENTVKGIREREPSSIEGYKKRVTNKMAVAQERLLDRVIEGADGMKPEAAAVAFGIVTDKLNLASGAPTIRVDVTGTRGADVYREFMDGLDLDGCITVEPSGTGYEAQSAPQRDLAAPSLLAPSPAHPATDTPSSDTESLDYLGKTSIPTIQPTKPAPEPSPDKGGGGGRRIEPGGG